MKKFWKYTDESTGKEVVCVAYEYAMYDTLCGTDLNDEGRTGINPVPVERGMVNCPHCLAMINAVLDLPLNVKRQARSLRGKSLSIENQE